MERRRSGGAVQPIEAMRYEKVYVVLLCDCLGEVTQEREVYLVVDMASCHLHSSAEIGYEKEGADHRHDRGVATAGQPCFQSVG